MVMEAEGAISVTLPATASQYQRHRGLGHAGDHLRDGQPRLHVAAHGVQQHQQAVHLLRLLDGGQQRQDVFIFGGLCSGGGLPVALDLADDGKAVDGAVVVGHHGGAKVHDLADPAVLLFLLCGLGGFCVHGCASFSSVLVCAGGERAIHPCVSGGTAVY